MHCYCLFQAHPPQNYLCNLIVTPIAFETSHQRRMQHPSSQGMPCPGTESPRGLLLAVVHGSVSLMLAAPVIPLPGT